MNYREAMDGCDITPSEAMREIRKHGHDAITKGSWVLAGPHDGKLERIAKIDSDGNLDSLDVMLWLGY